MDGMKWLASTMAAAQARLDIATTNLANAHVKGFQAQRFQATLTTAGINVASGRVAGDATAPDKLPFTNATDVMVEILQAQRNFETAQKTELAFDAVRTKEATEVGKAAV